MLSNSAALVEVPPITVELGVLDIPSRSPPGTLLLAVLLPNNAAAGIAAAANCVKQE
jgi:hypothetical protein